VAGDPRGFVDDGEAVDGRRLTPSHRRRDRRPSSPG
jgi:hypothetical protein